MVRLPFVFRRTLCLCFRLAGYRFPHRHEQVGAAQEAEEAASVHSPDNSPSKQIIMDFAPFLNSKIMIMFFGFNHVRTWRERHEDRP